MGYRRRFLQRIWRAIKLKLLVPLMRSTHPPGYTAAGTAVGLAWAFTPTPGIQMLLVFLTWVVARRLFGLDFHLLLGMAWTWISNVFTGPPVLYLSYVTGQIMLGRWHNISGYGSFQALWGGLLAEDQPFIEQVKAALDVFVKDIGLAIWVGCLPWCVLLGVLGYHWSLKFIIAYRHARLARVQRSLDGRRDRAGHRD
jgi:uncharacterized protein (DUF2062 family)